MVTETTCWQCGARVAKCDNNVLLDIPAEEYSDDPRGACWTIMQLGTVDFASVGNAGIDGRGHRLHEHQSP